MSHQLTRASFVWATLWDIACSIFENYNTLGSVSPHGRDYLWACGGGMESHTLRQMIAGLTGCTVRMRGNYRQSSAAGGAMLCGRALGRQGIVLGSPDEVVPDAGVDYGERYAEWKKMRKSLRTIFTA
ncbi:FGGY-family carbohydrate kinase [Puia sp. P3]|uniref:FGGY-family carbohydrate kinase n=1 Tax=Puia sp. P3 TaxID=3423952 RepID=UPI003D665696